MPRTGQRLPHVDVLDVEFGCNACQARITLPTPLIDWWAWAHRQPRILGLRLRVDGGPAHWWRLAR